MAGTDPQSRAEVTRSAGWAPALVSLLIVVAFGPATTPAQASSRPAERPNIVVVMTDDQDAASMTSMTRTNRLIGSRGVTFTDNIATNPVCCPSRSTYLTGQYSHTTGIFRNSPPHGGFTDFDDAETLPVRLQRAGYATALLGKYMNGYGGPDPTYIPPGWSWWEALVDATTYRMYGYRINENGTVVSYGDYDTPDPALYQTDVLAGKAVDYIDRQAGADRPFFLTVNPLAPHTEVYHRPEPGEDDAATPRDPNPRPAPRHLGAYDGVRMPRDPNFNERNVADKAAMVRTRSRISPFRIHRITLRWRARMASLLAVDEMVGSIVTALRRSGELHNTIIVYTSDNGYQRGQHRIPYGKQMPYEESLRVPLLIRGPGIPRGAVREQPVGNVDLAPTIAAWAGAGPGRSAVGRSTFDGTSIVPLIDSRREELGRALVIENWCQINEDCFDPVVPRYRGLRTNRFTYIAFPNRGRELYDLQRDPFQLRSRARDRRWAPNRRALKRLLNEIESCAGEACLDRPRIRFRISSRTGRLGGGRPCTARAPVVRPSGAERGSAWEIEGRLRGRRLFDDERPLKLRVPRSILKPRGASRLHLRVTALDGRVLTASRRIPRPC